MAAMLGGVALVFWRSDDDQLGILPYAGAAAAVCAVLAGVTLGGWLWVRSDPLRLNAEERSAIVGARRRLTWNPLAGPGKVSTGCAYALTGTRLVNTIEHSPAWDLAPVQAHRGRFDGQEELFQIACAAKRLDELETYLVGTGGDAEEPDVMSIERDQLTAALFHRLVVLHECATSLQNLTENSLRSSQRIDTSAFVAVVENELAAASLENITRDLSALAAASLVVNTTTPR
ncbi:hypothetical protein [Mycolicibacterium sp. XJ870]